jgi:hypothetical protein
MSRLWSGLSGCSSVAWGIIVCLCFALSGCVSMDLQSRAPMLLGSWMLDLERLTPCVLHTEVASHDAPTARVDYGGLLVSDGKAAFLEVGQAGLPQVEWSITSRLHGTRVAGYSMTGATQPRYSEGVLWLNTVLGPFPITLPAGTTSCWPISVLENELATEKYQCYMGSNRWQYSVSIRESETRPRGVSDSFVVQFAAVRANLDGGHSSEMLQINCQDSWCASRGSHANWLRVADEVAGFSPRGWLDVYRSSTILELGLNGRGLPALWSVRTSRRRGGLYQQVGFSSSSPQSIYHYPRRGGFVVSRYDRISRCVPSDRRVVWPDLDSIRSYGGVDFPAVPD